MIRWASVCLCALLIAACSRGGTQIILPALDRSAKIQLFCADLEQVTAVDFDLVSLLPLEACELETTELAPGFTPFRLGAVTQIQSGEVAAINFTVPGVFDTNDAVPGFTAFRVGEQPTGIQISPFDPEFTYVSSFSSKTVQAYPTARFLTSDEDPNLPPGDEADLRAGPTDLALYEFVSPATVVRDGGMVTDVEPGTTVFFRWLYAPIPNLGVVAQIEVLNFETGELGEPTFLELESESCDTTDPVTPPPSTPADYHRICPESGPAERFIKTVQTTTPCVDGPEAGPRPVAVSVDYGTDPNLFSGDDVLLVADANQPIIHRFRLDNANGATTALDPIVTNTPITALAVTPLVPASFDNLSATQRYLYAISSADGSVLAVDYTLDSPDFGAVLPVIAGISARANEENVESRNRVRSLFTNARAIEVVTPEYRLTADEPPMVPLEDLCEPLDSNEVALARSASNMRGVFLAVSLGSGSIFFLDIYDLNAPCRGGFCNSVTEPDAFASIRRHRRRFGITPTSFIETQGTPALVFNAAQGTLDPETGTARNSDGPGLEFIPCPESMFSVFGINPVGDADGLICTSSQVWSNAPSQRWDADWEGLIPASEGGLGKFSIESFIGEPGNWFLAGDVPFCEIGVLGPTDLPGATMIPGLVDTPYGGDRLVVTGELPPNRRDDPECQQFEDVPDEVDDFPVWFPIVRAFNDQLEIGASPNPNRYTLEQVSFCYDQFTEYQIQTQNAYTVVGTSSGFIHRVVPDPDTDECILDESRPITTIDGILDVDTVLSARAFPGVQFINPLVSFEIEPFAEGVVPTDSTVALLTFNISNAFGVLLLDTSAGTISLPSSMSFSKPFDRLYFVDLQRGVREITFEPLSTIQTFQ
ncbi:MAG: hypothetical protein OEM15_11800 [Myxococcales bacterium]|nr:hypothetical protein [Myxococcales bacterium]MDH3485181.1 hypothetical protein [Myxococcales bacterium]